MRRKDREIQDEHRIEEIIKACDSIRLGFLDKSEIYIVPMNFGYTFDGRYTFYFHSAKEGRKIDIIKDRPTVGFEMDTKYGLSTSDVACKFSSSFQSIIGTGIVEVIEREGEKKFALNRIMHKSTGRDDWDFDKASFDSVLTFKLIVDKLSCKEHE